MRAFDWHSDTITRGTPVSASYRNTQNVRRFFKGECGDHFKFDRAFMAWLKDGRPKTMGKAADEWLKRSHYFTVQPTTKRRAVIRGAKWR
jgi:Domain of unknown function (DUF6434)